jgi:hypothetical protein
MINDLPLFFDVAGKNSPLTRPIRMGFFHFSNNNLAIRKQCARDVGMYDPVSQKAEDADLCFRVAMNQKWVAWRENGAVVKHKGRSSWWGLLKQMWGYGYHVGYPYSKTGIRGTYLYWLNGRDHRLTGRFETKRFPFLVCGFVTDFHLVNALLLLLVCAACLGHGLLAIAAVTGLVWTGPRYLHDIRHLGLQPWETFKLALLHHLSNLSFTIAAFIGALRRGVVLIPPSVFKLENPQQKSDVPAKSGVPQAAAGIRGAQRYYPADDLWVVTCFFNPQSYLRRIENYHRFKSAFQKSGAHLVTVECVFENQSFSLDGPDVIRVKASDVMWQKERLLNLAISKLPSECKKIAWLDCDILFQNPRWLVQTSKLLDRFALVQPFQQVVCLPEGHAFYSGQSVDIGNSFASVFNSAPAKHLAGDFWKHGHTGFAWAARRDLLAATGLYEACVAGGGDHMMAHAACGDWESSCVYNSIVGMDYRNHFRQWAAEFCKKAAGSIGCVPGTILHLWHGEARNKRSYERLVELAAHRFDPGSDIRLGYSGALEWNSSKPELHGWLQNYFALRMEDGEKKR